MIKYGVGSERMKNCGVGSERMINYGEGSEMIITEKKRFNRKTFQNAFLNISCFPKLHFTLPNPIPIPPSS